MRFPKDQEVPRNIRQETTMTIMKIASVAAAALVLATSFAHAGNTGIQINGDILQLAKVAGCQVSGTPVEFPDDI